MKSQPTKKILRCAIYTRKSTEHNLDLEFNSWNGRRFFGLQTKRNADQAGDGQ